MKIITIDNYKNSFKNQTVLEENKSGMSFRFEKNLDKSLESYYDLDAIIFKLSFDGNYYALKCFTNIENESAKFIENLENEISIYKKNLNAIETVKTIKIEVKKQGNQIILRGKGCD